MVYIVFSSDADFEHALLNGVSLPHQLLSLPAIEESSLKRRLAHLLWRFNICISWNHFCEDFYNQIEDVNPGDYIIFFTYFPEPVLNLVPRLKKGVKPIVWLWDSLSIIGDQSKQIQLLKKAKCPIATFDEKDAITYNLSFIPQFYNLKLRSHNNLQSSPQFDFWLLTSPKTNDRQSLVSLVIQTLRQKKFKVDCLLVDYIKVQPISYADNIKHICNSKCIIDIVHKEQTGMTLRPMEALAFQKKLITNNRNIRNYDFYCPENIFIWEEDNIDELEAFITLPYKQIPEDVL